MTRLGTRLGPRLEQTNMGLRLGYLELSGAPRHLDRHLGWQRIKILGFRFSQQVLAVLAKVPRHLARHLGGQRAEFLGFAIMCLARSELAEVPGCLAMCLGWQRARIQMTCCEILIFAIVRLWRPSAPKALSLKFEKLTVCTLDYGSLAACI